MDSKQRINKQNDILRHYISPEVGTGLYSSETLLGSNLKSQIECDYIRPNNISEIYPIQSSLSTSSTINETMPLISSYTGPRRSLNHSQLYQSSICSPVLSSTPYSLNSTRQHSPHFSLSPASSPRNISPPPLDISSSSINIGLTSSTTSPRSHIPQIPCTSSKLSPLIGAESTRAESGLLQLTEKVIKYARQNRDLEIDLQEIEYKLGVPRRRLYDITNVLEAIGLFVKIRCNVYKLNLDIPNSLLHGYENDDNLTFYMQMLRDTEQNIEFVQKEINQLIYNAEEEGILYADTYMLSGLFPTNSNNVVSIEIPIYTDIILNRNQYSYQLLKSIRTRVVWNKESNKVLCSTNSDHKWNILLQNMDLPLNINTLHGNINVTEEESQLVHLLEFPEMKSIVNNSIGHLSPNEL
ncbi:transcription factor E2f/dimerization partner domain-containing protein [Cryptosporidium muris RN66]|uniref:Transcription factor E2f/dimerisation partner domain-containing protein n=1 Tax=Cryptosporidium muris (strain RN66) TaxID=441375 RepID=B6AGW6_CRYMR|nr:transcription factor E2f/dimerization partner domain-containing protein [Cryptosporidium muris RN66]EEA07457.1 transcription factor E2f/dimerisation partner domain-containing protein [Cryptosporidium muris RN66]|eukprot:XP_002141806.1 transcription factor E2f/dimerisation partner domain-containing protein [Cryptosporidium muris RN66]